MYNISKVAYEGGTNIANVPDDITPPLPAGDPISKQTAWLYDQYFNDQLDSFDLNGDTLANDYQYTDDAWATALQSVFWKLEEEGNLGGSDPWSFPANTMESDLYNYVLGLDLTNY